ncbi:MAG: hypothetical protein WBP82_09825 [Leuconostoc mesenteroides]
MNKKYENQILRIIKKGIKERVFSVDSTFTDEQKVLKNNYENHLYMTECVNLFWMFEEKYNRIPSQSEYVEAYKYYSFENLKNKSWYDDDKDKEFITKCIEWRADRAYKSNLIELMTVKQLEMLGYTVFRHKYIDVIMGVDLVVVKDGKCWYIHITKNTDYSRNKVFDKGSYTSKTLDKKNFRFHRDFRRHVKFLYSCNEGKNNTVKNGLPLFKNDYVLSKLDDKHAFDFNDEYNQLRRLSRSVIRQTIKFTSTDNKMVVSETSE